MLFLYFSQRLSLEVHSFELLNPRQIDKFISLHNLMKFYMILLSIFKHPNILCMFQNIAKISVPMAFQGAKIPEFLVALPTGPPYPSYALLTLFTIGSSCW